LSTAVRIEVIGETLMLTGTSSSASASRISSEFEGQTNLQSGELP
jgi:hypothetical protein